jgi:hypothetical protein
MVAVTLTPSTPLALIFWNRSRFDHAVFTQKGLEP